MLEIKNANNFRRTALGLCLIAGPLLALVGGLVTPWETADTTAAYLTALAGNPARAQASAVLLYFGYLLMAVGVFGMMHLLRRRAVVLGHVAGALAVWGWVSLPGMLSVDFYDLSLARYADREAAIGISDRAGGYAGSAVMGVPVLLGILGLVLLVVALWRAGFVPAWVPAVLFVGTAASFVGPPTAVYFTVGTAAWLASLGYVGSKMLRMSDEEWERGEAPARGEVDTVAEAPAA
jgi:hypothetical protein